MKGNKKILIILTIFIIILALITILALYFFTDIFKSKKEVFNKYLVQSESQFIDEKFFQTYLNANLREIFDSNSTTTNINLYSTNLTEDKIGEISIASLKDVNLQQDYKIFKILDNNQELASLKYVRDGDIIALGADNILTKYIAVDRKYLKSFASRLGVQSAIDIPKTISKQDYNQLISTNNELVSELKQKYINIILNNIEEEKYATVKNEDDSESFILTLSNQDIASILEKILEEAKNDSVLLNLIKEKVDYTGYDIEIANIQEKITKIINELAQIYSQEGELKISLIVKDKNVIKYIVETPSFNYNGKTIKESQIYIDCSQVGVTQINLITNEKNYKIIINYSYSDNAMNLGIKVYDIINEENKEILSFENEILDYNSEKMKKNIKINTAYEQEQYKIVLEEETIFKQDIQIEKLTTDNSARIDLMTDEQLNNFVTAITQRIVELYRDNLAGLLEITNDVENNEENNVEDNIENNGENHVGEVEN